MEAGVDPVFQELAQPEALRVFGRVFQRWIERRLASPSPALVRALARLAWREERDGAEPLDALRQAAWSLAEWRDFDAPWDQRGFDRDAAPGGSCSPRPRARSRCATAARARAISLYDGLRPLAEFVERVRLARDAGRFDANLARERTAAAARANCGGSKRGAGQYGDGVSREARLGVLGGVESRHRAVRPPRRCRPGRPPARRAVGGRRASIRIRRSAPGSSISWICCWYARDLLRHDGARAPICSSDYQRIFVDEFQDTDPLQAEILLLLAAADPAERDWRKATPAPGKLYVVGDPKQSIYRFRRADARLFRRCLPRPELAPA